jgi:prepilin-type N-terminal cleavage/methylation domain-containing protein
VFRIVSPVTHPFNREENKMSNPHTAMKRSAFTLVELLVVIAIIGLLIALLLPAVQSAREAARRMQCSNHLTQLTIAVRNYEQNFGLLPSGTVNEPGPIRNVPLGNHMGWIPRLLPFIEQTALYDKIDFNKGVYDPENRDVWGGTPSIPILRCPSDGRGWSSYSYSSYGRQNAPDPYNFGCVNYMACHSSTETPIDADNDGVFCLNSKLRSRDIPDGTSHTIFFGEANVLDDNQIKRDATHYSGRKIILPEGAEGPFVYGNLGWMSGTPGTMRNTGNPPNVYVGPFSNWAMPREVLTKLAGESNDPDAKPVLPAETWAEELPGQFLVGGFGSYHSQVTNFAFGDGSIRTLNNGINLDVFRQLGSRKSSEPATVSPTSTTPSPSTKADVPPAESEFGSRH